MVGCPGASGLFVGRMVVGWGIECGVILALRIERVLLGSVR
jgi:hypothetical protein